MSFGSKPKETPEQKQAAIAQRNELGKRRRQVRAADGLLNRGSARNGLLGGPESGMRTTLGVTG